ncbi:MAG: Thiol-disulfide isomerase and thioredoxin [Chthonomonadaceae bacterium]|nr:Thiol-disulfide isomerase and thioredoxin [Chthonomonadaceae bacterium]
MNLSNKKRSWRVIGVMVGLMVGGIAAIVAPVRAQESSAPTAVPLAQVADVPHIEKAIKAMQGKVVLVNFWAAWNEPSIAQYPAFVFLYDRYHARGLEVISVATDPVAEREAHVIPFIQDNRTKFGTYLKAEGDPVAFLHGIDTAWTGNLPRTYLLGRDGKVRQVYANRIDPVRFEATIQRLLKEDAPKPKPAKNGKPEDTAPIPHPKGILGGN